MWQRARNLAIGGVVLSSMLALATEVCGAEFRTSVRGRQMVRTANYQETVEEVAPLDAPEMQSIMSQPAGPVTSMEYPSDCCGDPGCIGDCATGCCAPCGGLSTWGSVEFLLWWRKGQNLPPLVTTSPTTTPENDAGVLGMPGTEILYANEEQSGDARPGARLTAGVWFGPCQLNGFGTRLFSLGESTAHYDQDSSVVSVLARPFFNLDLGVEDAVQIAYPGSTTGSISVRNTSRVAGGDIFFRRLFFTDGCRRIDLIAGYQYARIDTDLSINSNLRSIGTGGTIPIDTTVQVIDSFDTSNTYSAGEIGLWGLYDRGPVTWSLIAKVGLGNMRQRTTIAGQTIAVTPNLTPSISNQGLLALSTNSGVFNRSVFSVSPELAFNGAYHLNNCIDLTFGYSFIYWSHVAQPGDQIDRGINPTQLTGALVGPARPAPTENDAGYLVHGLNFGIQWVW